MKILLILISTLFFFAESYGATNKFNHLSESNEFSFSSGKTLEFRFHSGQGEFTPNLIKFSFSKNNSSKSKKKPVDDVFYTGLTGTIALGLIGALIGYNMKTRCYESSMFEFCTGDREGACYGALIGGVAGSILGFTSKRKEIKKNVPVFRIVVGSVIGGVVSYYLCDKTFCLGSFIFPPLGANIMLHL